MADDLTDDRIFPCDAFQPAEAALLHEASRRAIASFGAHEALSEQDRRNIAANVIKLARSGYTRTIDGALDPADLAAAAVLRFKSLAAR